MQQDHVVGVCPTITHNLHSFEPSVPSRLPALPRQVLRLSSQDVPTSYAYDLEAATIVQVRAHAVGHLHLLACHGCGLRGRYALDARCSCSSWLRECAMVGAVPWHIAAPGKLQRPLHASLPSYRPTSSLLCLQPEKVIEAVHKICGVRAGV